MLVVANKTKRVAFLIFVVISIMTLVSYGAATADEPSNYSSSDLQSILGETPFYDPDASCSPTSSSTATVTITGNNVEDSFNFFTQNGYSAIQAAGIVGNLMWESDGTGGSINPTAEQEGGGGYGIAQFTATLLTELMAWSAAQNLDYTTLSTQLQFLLYDLNTNYPTVVASLKATTTISDATSAFMNGYERPEASVANLQNRINDAQTAYNAYGNGGSTSSASSSSGCASSSSTDCTTATGDAKILCEALPFQGVYYEYGGGHEGFAAFIAACPNPADPPDNQPSGGPVNGDPEGVSGNPSPCAVDCSGLVSIATDEAFNQTYMWTVDNYEMQGSGSQYWQPIPLSQVQPGDIVTLEEHVEIVDNYDSSTGVLTTFGAHETGTADGTVTSTLSSWNAAYQYTGPGS